MKALKFITIACCLLAAILITSAFYHQNRISNTNTANDKDKSFAVIELFTSEGCSSCPPADALVAKIQSETVGQPIYVLAFHVDYWDRLGWKDLFSSPDFSKRQNQYANWLKLKSVYTPQIVVNGQTEFVGSQENSLRSAIKTELQKISSAQLELKNIKVDNGKASLQYDTKNAGVDVSLLLAVVQKNAITNVQRGENSGKKLMHVQIVRKFENILLNGKSNGTAVIELPQKINSNEMEIIALLQNMVNGKIIAAAKVNL